jgi:hypothetical protein
VPDVFACAGCGTTLTAPVSKVALPVHAHQKVGNGLLLPALMAEGTYAVDSTGGFVIAPGDTRELVLDLDRCDGYCCGLDDSHGPNLACVRCGRAVATRVDDCSLWQAVWLVAESVVVVNGPVDPVVAWADLAREYEATSPYEPIRRVRRLYPGYSDPRWEATVGAALAHLLAASAGEPLALPGGPVTTVFGHALEALLPSGPPARTVMLAGPGLPTPDADVLLVPRHPQTGELWQPDAVPLAADAWLYLAFHNDRLLYPASGGLPDDVLRDEPPPHQVGRFRPDWWVFTRTLARLPMDPWLREIHDRVGRRPYADPF